MLIFAMLEDTSKRKPPFGLRIPDDWELEIEAATARYEPSRHKYILKSLRNQLDTDNAGRLPTVYRFYDADDELLYVGTTDRLSARLGTHRGQSPWWSQVVFITVVPYETREAAAQAEAVAIATEAPLHNVAHGGAAKSVSDDPTIAVTLRLPLSVRTSWESLAQKKGLKLRDLLRQKLTAAVEAKTKP